MRVSGRSFLSPSLRHCGVQLDGLRTSVLEQDLRKLRSYHPHSFPPLYPGDNRIFAFSLAPAHSSNIMDIHQLVLRTRVLVDNRRRGLITAECPGRTDIEAVSPGCDFVGSLALAVIDGPRIGAIGLRFHGAHGPIVAWADGDGGGCDGERGEEGGEEGGEKHFDCVEGGFDVGVSGSGLIEYCRLNSRCLILIRVLCRDPYIPTCAILPG